MKIYRRAGKAFGIYPLEKPPIEYQGETIVFFTEECFSWMKEKLISDDEFLWLWNMKREDFRYNPIPEEEYKNGKEIAEKYVGEIIRSLKPYLSEPSSPGDSAGDVPPLHAGDENGEGVSLEERNPLREEDKGLRGTV